MDQLLAAELPVIHVPDTVLNYKAAGASSPPLNTKPQALKALVTPRSVTDGTYEQ